MPKWPILLGIKGNCYPNIDNLVNVSTFLVIELIETHVWSYS